MLTMDGLRSIWNVRPNRSPQIYWPHILTRNFLGRIAYVGYGACYSCRLSSVVSLSVCMCACVLRFFFDIHLIFVVCVLLC